MRENQVIISVFMGVYNPREAYLKAAVESIGRQTFPHWEFLIYDDGSEEKAAEMIRKVAKTDPRIRLFRGEENRGLAYGLNVCIKAMRGKYGARMDDDDLSAPDRLSRLYEFLETHQEYGWAGSAARLFDEQGVWGRETVKERPKEEDFLACSPYIHPSVMFRKEVLESAGGYRASGQTRRCEDYELFMRLHTSGYCGFNLQEPLLDYRESRESYKKRNAVSRIREMQVRFQGFQKLGILKCRTIPYVLRPVAAGVLPGTILFLRRKRMHGETA